MPCLRKHLLLELQGGRGQAPGDSATRVSAPAMEWADTETVLNWNLLREGRESGREEGYTDE